MDQMKVLVTDKLADAGIAVLREKGFQVDMLLDLTPEQSMERIRRGRVPAQQQPRLGQRRGLLIRAGFFQIHRGVVPDGLHHRLILLAAM